MWLRHRVSTVRDSTFCWGLGGVADSPVGYVKLNSRGFEPFAGTAVDAVKVACNNRADHGSCRRSVEAANVARLSQQEQTVRSIRLRSC